MVVYQAPQEVADRRKNKIKRQCQKKGRRPTAEYLQLQEYTIFITNVSAEIWSKEIIGTIYRVRWQIELIFKQWKQLFRIDVMIGSREERIQCLVYGRLIMILTVTSICGFGFLYAYHQLAREVSSVKLIQWLKRNGRLSEAILSNRFEILLTDLLRDIPKILLKQKRKRKTTFMLLQDQVRFLESFETYNE